MANNIDVKDAAAATKTMKTTDNAGVHTAHHNVDSSALPTGAATEATLLLVEGAVDGIEALLGGTLAVSAASLPLPTGASTEATLASALTSLQTLDNAISGTEMQVDIVAALPSGTNNIGDVDIASIPAATSGGAANVSSSATTVTLLASNASRKGFTIYNDSTQILYLKFGAIASSTSFHVKMVADSYYESPAGFIYTGVIDGIWASANGAARVGEFT